MSRRERSLRKANRLELRAFRAAVRAANARNPFGWSAIRAGAAASKGFARANAIRVSAEERERARQREKEARRKKPAMEQSVPRRKRSFGGRL